MLVPSRLTRYVLSELFTPTMLGLLLYTFVLLMNEFFVVAEKALSKNLGADLTLRLFLTAVPAILILAIPMAVLLGSLIAMGRLSSDQEWVAIQSGGHGPMRLLRPLLIHGAIASLVGFLVYSELAPAANYARRDLSGQILLSSNLAADLKPRVFYTNVPNTVLYVEEIRAGSSGRLEGILLVRTDPRNERYEVTLASSGDIYPVGDGSQSLMFDLNDGFSHRYRPDTPDEYSWVRSFRHVREPLPQPDYLKALLEPPTRVVQDMTTGELLREYRESLRARDETLAQLTALEPDRSIRPQDRFMVDARVRASTIEISARGALPLASFCFTLLALPLGIRRARSGKGAGFALSLLVILVYWATYTFFRDQSASGQFPAALGPWMANFVILPWALWALWRMRRPREDGTGLFAAGLAFVMRQSRWLARFFSRRKTPRPSADSVEAADLDSLRELENLGGTTNRFVSRLDQYVGLTFLRYLVFAIGSAYMLYGIVELKGLVDGLLRTRQPVGLLLQYFQYFAPGVLHIVLPISCLVGSVVAFTLLARTGELTAIKASGTSMRRVTVPVLVLTAALSGLLFLVEDSVAPTTNRRAQEIEDRILGRPPKTYGLPQGGRWSFGPEGRRLYHYRLYNADQAEFQALTVFTLEREPTRIVAHRYAPSARWLGSEWELEGGWRRTFGSDGSAGDYERFEGVYREKLDPPTLFAGTEISLTSRGGDLTDQLRLSELRQEVQTLAASGYDTTTLEVAFHGKIARSVAPVVMVLLGLPFAFRVGRRGSLYGIGVALLLVLVYWAVFAIFNALGLETILEPWAAAWAPNILFGLLGLYLMLYVQT